MLKIFAVNKTASLNVYFRVGRPLQDVKQIKSNLPAIFSVYLAFMQESCLKLNQHHQPSNSTQKSRLHPGSTKTRTRKQNDGNGITETEAETETET